MYADPHRNHSRRPEPKTASLRETARQSPAENARSLSRRKPPADGPEEAERTGRRQPVAIDRLVRYRAEWTAARL